MRTSAAAGAAHLTLANGYARLTALAAQLRQLQRAAAPALPALAGDPAAPQLGVGTKEVPCLSSQDCMLSLQSETPAALNCDARIAQADKEVAQPAPEAPVVLLQRPKPAQLQVWQPASTLTQREARTLAITVSCFYLQSLC